MSVESLANELLLDLFEYLDGFSLLSAFRGLNARFDHLLFHHFRAYRFDFRSIPKDAFDALWHRYLPMLLDRMVALTLSENDDTPNLPGLFLAHHFTLDRSIRLQSLCLDSMQSGDLLRQIVAQCRAIPHLTCLRLTGDAPHVNKFDQTDLVNDIWSLPKLRYCSIDYQVSPKFWLSKISIVSDTIQRLSIEKITCTLQDLRHLFQHTPRLEYLCTTIIHCAKEELISPISTMIRSLDLTLESSSKAMLVQVFCLMPNLVSLALRSVGLCVSGRRWKKLFRNYLPHLKNFRLRMYFAYRLYRDIDEQMTKLIETYRTPFWIEEHQWHIQCYCIPFGRYQHGILYTLPYSFDTYIYHHATKSISTCPNSNCEHSYGRVTHLQCRNNEPTVTDTFPQRPMRFSNLRHLRLTLPFDNLVVSLDRVTTLEVTLIESETARQLSTLLDRCPRINWLRIVYVTDLYISFAEITSPSIRHLDFIPADASNVHYFDQFQCRDFTNSSIGRQCEVLTIQVEHRRNVLGLLRAMRQLRSLIVHCKGDQWNDHQGPLIEDELVLWLRELLPRGYSISRAYEKISHIRIWIDRNADLTV